MNRYVALAVAKYILSLRPMTNLRLQKTLYFIQVAFLLTRERGIFDDEIEAWQYGPVVPSVYNEYKYSSRNILTYNREMEIELFEKYVAKLESEAKEFETFRNLGITNENIIEEVDRLDRDFESVDLIQEMLGRLENFTDWQLVEKTHTYAIWQEHFNNSNNVMTEQEILNYHRSIGGFNVRN